MRQNHFPSKNGRCAGEAVIQSGYPRFSIPDIIEERAGVSHFSPVFMDFRWTSRQKEIDP